MKIVEDVKYHVEIAGYGEPLATITWIYRKSWIHGNFLSHHLQCSYQLIMVDIIGHGKTESPVDIERYRDGADG